MFPDGGPPHIVTFAQTFAVGKFAVTFSEWDACVTAGGCDKYVPKDLGYGRGRLPVVYVNWQDAHKYTQWLSKKTGKKYRLLSEAEWEYVARANTTTAYYWGDEVGTNNANCGGCGSEWDTHKLAPVGSFAPNNFGLYDMLGNVWQWTEDCWHKDYVDAPSDGDAWIARGDCSKRVMRGGGYQNPSFIIRAANRNSDKPTDRSYSIGFRVARAYP
jgi:formylglycine-generating enzyme required for sulfatase activity